LAILPVTSSNCSLVIVNITSRLTTGVFYTALKQKNSLFCLSTANATRKDQEIPNYINTGLLHTDFYYDVCCRYTKLCGLSPRANYIDRAIATCRRS
jgi:hypothetical protein